MDSNASASRRHGSKRASSIGSRPAPSHQSHSEDTEDGSTSLAPTKRRKRITKAKGHVADDDSSKGVVIVSHQGTCSSNRRRRRHSSSRGSPEGEEDNEASHGLNTLSIAACNSSRGKSRYNFCQELDPDLDAGKRIAVLQSRMQELKRTYMQVKAELASVERRRKKLRKKERESKM